MKRSDHPTGMPELDALGAALDEYERLTGGPIMGPEDNPRDDQPVDREDLEEWNRLQYAQTLVCVTCGTSYDKPQPQCNFCGDPVCFECRTHDVHDHPDMIPEERAAYRVGFCVACREMKPLVIRDGKYRCASCDYEWTPRAIKGVTAAGEFICPFCGALQMSVVFPFHCGRCAMELR